MTRPRVLVNGTPIDSVSVHDRGFQYGDGLFETFAVRDGTPLLWDRHIARLQHGADRLRLMLPEVDLLEREALALCEGLERAVLKLVITRGHGGRGYRPPAETTILRAFSVHDWPTSKMFDDVTVRLCQMRLSINPALAGIKHLNRLEHVLARAEWGDEFAEGILLDVAGRVVEGTASNIFIVKDGGLFTPDLSDCGVAGIVRAVILERAAALGIRCQVAPISVDALSVADEVFLTNSVIGIRPVTRFEQRTYAIGETTQILRKELETVGATV